MNKIFKSIGVCFSFFFFIGLIISANISFAAVTTESAMSTLPYNATISPASATSSVIGLNLATGAADTLSRLRFTLNPGTGFDLAADLETMTAAGTSGLSLYKDNKSTGRFGSFDSADTPIALSIAPTPIRPELVAKLTPGTAVPVANADLPLNVGDIVYAYVTANPTGSAYGWHIVTTGSAGGPAGTDLRLDDASSAPTYSPNTLFSKFVPSASFQTDGLNNSAGQTDAVGPGILVFTKRATESTYGWHVVSSAPGSILSDDATENTGTLDGQAGDPAIASLATIAVVVPASQGVIDNGVAAGGKFAVLRGDLVFTNITGLGYGWHIVSRAGTLSSNAAENAGTEAYIDGGSALPSIVEGSAMTKLSSTGGYAAFNIATTTPADISTVYTAGDVAFVQVTNNPQSTVGPTWRMITTGGTGAASADLRMNHASARPIYGWVVNMIPATPAELPANDVTANTGQDYFITAKTAASATNGHIFSLGMNPGDITFDSGTPANAPGVVNPTNITVDSTPIAVSNVMPSNNATGIPVSTFINAMFTKNIDPLTINNTNVTLTTGGNPVKIAFKTYPDGFNVIMSDKPTFTASSRFAKVANTAYAFFQIGSSGSIYPQDGLYTAPVEGDIIYFQHGTFPMELGVVTNATLTGGVFSVNGFPLTGGQAIAKFATPTATGAVSSAGNTGVGDLLVVNTGANPSSGGRYAWHIVTTAAAVNNAALRLDGSAGAPSYNADTIFSRLMPTATSTVAADTTLTEGLNLPQGGMIFAKVATNADNLNSYAWHLVTTAENIGASGTTSALRLDGALAAPTFAADSVIAYQASAANGASTDAGDTTNFNVGNLVLAKTTANASNNDSYNFHLVSADAVGVANNSLRFDNVSNNLTASSQYTLTIGTGVRDVGGNSLASPSVTVFTTGATGGTNTTPPYVISTTPMEGTQAHPTTAPIKVEFSQAMAIADAGSVLASANVGVYLESNGVVGAVVPATNTYDSATRTVTITMASPLTASRGYVIKVASTAKSSTGTNASERRVYFRTSGGTDSTRPTITGVYPGNTTTGIQRNLGAISIGFSEDMNPGTINTNTITLSGGISGNVSYDNRDKRVYFSPSQTLAANTTYTVTVTTGVADMSGNTLSSTYTSTFTTATAADEAAPTVQFANADDFSLSVTFSEPMRSGGSPDAADSISNYSLESPIGSSISLGGKTISYDGPTMTAKITGLSLQNGQTFKVTVATITHDLAGNGVSAAGSPASNIAQGTVMNASVTGGQIGPGSGQQQSAADQGMNPVRVMPASRMAGATSNYTVEFPVTTAVPAGGTVVLTFPVGFDVTSAAAVATAESSRNADINGYTTGTVTIASVSGNASARTVTITTAGASTGANSFISFDLKNIVNTSVPSQSGYTVDIKTNDASRVLLESKTSSSFYLGSAGSYTLTVNVFQDDGTTGGTAGNNTKDGGESAIASAKLYLYSPATGGMGTTTRATGSAYFENLAAGTYDLALDPSSVSFPANSKPQTITISGNTSKNYGLGATGGSALTIGGTITGPASTAIDVWASSMNGFSKTTVTTNGAGTVAYSLPVEANTNYRVGMGPAMPEFIPGSTPPKAPTFTFMPPAEVMVSVASANVTGQNFTLTSASKTITGSVVDSSNAAISNAMLFARPASDSNVSGTSSTGMGVGGETGPDGTFTLNVVPGSYVVEVFKAGMPNMPGKQINVPASGANSPTSLTFKLDATTGITISGSVKDDSGNAIPYAGVGARKVNSAVDTTTVGGGMNNFVGSPTAADGTYTLYVDAGTWVIEAFAPGVGYLGSKTVTVASSLTGQDFSAATLSLGTITGQALKATVAQSGVIVRAEGSAGKNMTVTDANGNYSLKVPAGSYTIYSDFPGVGAGTPLTSVAVTAGNTTSGQDIALAAPITLTINVTNGASAITNAFVEARDSNGRGNMTTQSSTSGVNAVYTLNVAPGTYTVRVGHPAYGPIGSTSGVNSTRTITYTATAGTLYTITGTVQAGGSALGSAWAQLIGIPTGQTNPIMVGGSTNSSGEYSVSVPAGSYNLRADKPGYISPAERAVTVSANAAMTVVSLTAANRTISGSVLLSSAGVSGAFVSASNGNGGFATAQTDSAGAYSLSVIDGTWTVSARSMGYESADSTVTVSGGNATKDITVTAISGFTPSQRRQESFTPNVGGMLTNSDIGERFKMNVPANALGTDSTAATLNTQPTTNVPKPPKGTVLSKNAVTISATDSGGQPITSLSSCVTITVPYTEADLPEGASEGDLVIGAWNDATQNYDTWSTTVDTTNNTLTACVTHFSDFAPVIPTVTTPVASTPAAAAAPSYGGGIVGSYGSVNNTANNTQKVAIVSTTNTDGTTTKTPVYVTFFTKGFLLGQRSSQIKDIQALLNSDPDTQIAKSGAGSPGKETDKLGPLTLTAIKKFQVKWGLAKPGVVGYGNIGPKTLAKLNELANKKAGVNSEVGATTSNSNPKIIVTSKSRMEMIVALLEKIKELQKQLKELETSGR